VTPGTLVLLHAPHSRAESWGDLPETLRRQGLDVIAPDVPDDPGPRYVARASLIIAAERPVAPLVLVAAGGAGPLVPAVALAQRAAHRQVGGYVFVDADLPRPQHQQHDHGETAMPIPPDWPEAPCAYLRRAQPAEPAGSAEPAGASREREARLRGWAVAEQRPGTSAARALTDLIAAL
jgi:hypothetical protein